MVTGAVSKVSVEADGAVVDVAIAGAGLLITFDVIAQAISKSAAPSYSVVSFGDACVVHPTLEAERKGAMFLLGGDTVSELAKSKSMVGS